MASSMASLKAFLMDASPDERLLGLSLLSLEHFEMLELQLMELSVLQLMEALGL